MKKLLFFLFLPGVLISCSNDVTINTNDIYQRWEIMDFMSVESVLYIKNPQNELLITFRNDGTYQLKLDVNNCSGKITTEDENKIEITAPGCTKICCDSNFSAKIAEMLPQVKSYTLEGNELKLNIPGWGWINLKLN